MRGVTKPLSQAISPSLAAVPSSRRRHTKRILVVDDDTVVLQLFIAVLTDAGYKVVAYPSGVAAVQNVRSAPRFDVLMTDLQMPAMDGIALASFITRVRRSLPVLIVSGASPETITLSKIWSRNWCFLAKPMRAPSLLETIDYLCGLKDLSLLEADMLGFEVTPSQNRRLPHHRNA